MGTHNICFHGEIRKILCGYPLLSVAMYKELELLSVQFIKTLIIAPSETMQKCRLIWALATVVCC